MAQESLRDVLGEVSSSTLNFKLHSGSLQPSDEQHWAFFKEKLGLHFNSMSQHFRSVRIQVQCEWINYFAPNLFSPRTEPG